MRLSWLYPPLVAVALAFGATCSLGDDNLPTNISPPGVSGPNATLAFDSAGTLELTPGEKRTVWVTGSPAASYELSFTLLGQTAGAWLDRTTVVADTNGRASVELHAGSLATTFRLRATIKEGPSVEIGVAVSDKGFATVRVFPLYNGPRQVTEWTASVTAATSCAEIANLLPGEPEGALVATGLPPVEVKSAPVGPNLAIALRAGHAVFGCVDKADLHAATTQDVKVPVKDVPIDLAATNLDLTLTYNTGPETETLFEGITDQVIDAFFPLNAQATTLLDSMQIAVPANQLQAFQAERNASNWDSLVAAHLNMLPMSPRDLCQTWAEQGLAQQDSRITGYLSSSTDLPNQAHLSVDFFGSVSASDAGIPATQLMSWTAEPSDVLRLEGALFWIPSRYVAATAWQAAQEALPMATSMSDAFAEMAQCQTLAATLVGYMGCDSSCLADLCKDGFATRWQLAMDASPMAGLVGGISISGSGTATVNDVAAPIGWNALWLGTISDGLTEIGVQGAAEATESGIVPN